MADEIDRANDRAQAWLDGLLDESRYQAANAPAVFAAGLCRNCETPLDDGRSYCDAACRDDHQKRIAAAARP